MKNKLLLAPGGDVDLTKLRRAWGDHLGRYEWDHVVTLTTPFPRSAAWLKDEFSRRYVRRLEKAAQGAVPWFWVAEEHGSRHLHVHALLWGTALLTTEYLRDGWSHGFTDVQRYDRSRGAARYLAKTIGGAHDSYDHSSRTPPTLVVAESRPIARVFADIEPCGLSLDFGTIGAVAAAS
jgi:hypothetical protein